MAEEPDFLTKNIPKCFEETNKHAAFRSIPEFKIVRRGKMRFLDFSNQKSKFRSKYFWSKVRFSNPRNRPFDEKKFLTEISIFS